MDKLKMQTENIADKNYEMLSKMFPNALTETITGYDEDGKPIVERAIDADVLRQEISCKVVDGKDERYQFIWPDKKKAILLANAPIDKTLRPYRDKSVNFDNTENIYIEGDNLEVLKLLQETYLGKIKMIYIDPPYNTGNDFVYEDDFAEDISSYMIRSGNYDGVGNRLFSNSDNSGRYHTDWINMIYPRIKLARNLLTDDGAIFISIDDNECENLKKICDEIFGLSCYVATISWRKTYSPRNDAHGISGEVEYILVYGKSPNWQPNKLPRTEKMNSVYKNPDNDHTMWRTSDAFAPSASTHQGMVYAIQHPITGELLYPYNGACWPLEQSKMLEQMQEWAEYELVDLNDDERRAQVCGISKEEVRKNIKAIMLAESLESAKTKSLEIIKRGQWPRFFFTKNGSGGIARKTYLDDSKGKVVTNFWSYEDVGHTDEAKKELKSLFGGKAPFDTPKPVRLLERIIHIATNENDIVLDFFAGSATTAQAVMNKNHNDNTQRKYILVQLPEESKSSEFDTLCDIGEKRIKLAANIINDMKIDCGFRVLKCDTTNMKDVYYTPTETQQSLFDTYADNIKEDRTPEDLLFQVMLDLGVLLSSKIEETTIEGKKVFNVADGFLIACFDKDVTEETVKAVAEKKPYYAVFRDSSMADDSVATDFDQIFASISPETVRKVL